MRNALLKNFQPIAVESMRPAGFHEEKLCSVQQCCRKVDQGGGWLAVAACPVCGSAQHDVLMQKCGVDIVQCQECSLGYAAMAPKNAADVYADQQYLGQAKRDYEHNVSYRLERFAVERVNILRKWSGKEAKDCVLLDIGCGTGWFLDCCRQEGYTVFGQELGNTLAEYTAKRSGIPIWSCPIAEIDKKSKFDIITMFDVLEHTANPVVMLTQVKRLLQHGGIALLFVPHLHSLGAAILQEESALVAPAEHLLYFTKQSMRHLVGKVGLDLLHIETKGMDIPDLIAYYRDRKKNKEVTAFLLEHGDLFQAVIDDAGRANHMRVVLRNPAR
jgi:2-polyprenyl-3-methyl-5-hydroxy-6-metoxy-1,4-benzoquinol methylase